MLNLDRKFPVSSVQGGFVSRIIEVFVHLQWHAGCTDCAPPMRFDSSTWLLFLAAGAVAAAASVACSSAPPSDVEGSSSAATSSPFDKNAVLDDTSLKDSDAMTVAQIQTFLDKNPWGKK